MSQTRYLKSMITPTLVEPTENHQAGVASGVWSTQDQLEARRGGVWPEAGVTNPDSLIENNFSTFLYTGNAAARTITNNINLSGKGGLVWTKKRNDTVPNTLVDTERGTGKYLEANGTGQEQTGTNNVTGFTSTGYTIGATAGAFNDNNDTYVSWTWKKAPKFFDIQTYTGDGENTRTLSHNLTTDVGMVMIKGLNESENWTVYHRGLSAGRVLRLDVDGAEVNLGNGVAHVSGSTITLSRAGNPSYSGNDSNVNYIAYIFAHETGDDSMIQCGQITGNGNDNREIDLGWEPQFVMFKRLDSSSGGSWFVYDNMRGLVVGGADPYLRWDTTAAEDSDQNYLEPTPIGFKIGAKGDDDGAYFNQSGRSYIYMAIRRPNMATITDATEVFSLFNQTAGDGTGNSEVSATVPPFPTDLLIHKWTGSREWDLVDRMRGKNQFFTTDSNVAEFAESGWFGGFDRMAGYAAGSNGGVFYGTADSIAYFWKRAKGYFDMVCYTGTGSARTIAHGLGAAPEMMWIKRRNGTSRWFVYSKHAPTISDTPDIPSKQQYMRLDDDGESSNIGSAYWNDTDPTATVFSLANTSSTNGDGDTFIAYLFATLAGVSKLGSVTHSGSSTDVDCGFSAGARLVMLKRTDATGDWYWWDSVRGIIAGNDPYLLLNTTAAQVTNTDFIDPLASGFQISGDFTDGDYIFYAIA
ncbi:hypothetical protein OAV83_00140 [bacterium]|nr:hypothetical protein [bacterium]